MQNRHNELSPKSKRKIKSLLVIVIACFGAYFIWDILYPSRQVNYRLDVTFEVDGVPVTGSGVFQLTVWAQPELITFVSGGQETTGEAVTLELPNRSDLFVLMAVWNEEEWVSTSHASPRFDDLLYYACGVHDRWKKERLSAASIARIIAGLKGTCLIPDEQLPIMVRFGNSANPATVERVYPDHPETTLDDGVKFIEASVTITNAAITNGVSQRLPWLDEEAGSSSILTKAMSEDQNTSTFARSLVRDYFKR